jgi:hypothetical protein
MPSRSFVVAVIACWLAANFWLFHREVWPRWRSGEAPPYTIDLTEELGNPASDWEMLQKGKVIGRALSRVERRPDRTYALHTDLYFRNFPLPLIVLTRISTAYRVTEEGDLRGLWAQFVGRFSREIAGISDFDVQIDGTVENGEVAPKLRMNQLPLPLGDFKVPIRESGSVLNPMQLLNRVPGLSVGRSWRMHLFDPVQAFSKALPEYREIAAAAEGMTIPELHAEVVADTLHWDDQDVACFKIEYRKPGEPDPVAATWVRRRDGLVLQQQSASGLFELTLRRVPAH